MKIFSKYSWFVTESDYGTITDDDGVLALKQAMSIRLRFGLVAGEPKPSIIKLLEKDEQYKMYVDVSSSKLYFAVYDGTDYEPSVSMDIVLPSNGTTWYDVVATLDFTTVIDKKLYLNGKFVSEEKTQTGAITTNTNAVTLNGSGCAGMGIKYDVLQFWSKVLSEADVQRLYNGELLEIGSLVAWYQFEQDLADIMGNMPQITFTGGSWVDGYDMDKLRNEKGKVIVVRKLRL